MRLRVYLILVDGIRSTEMIQTLNPALSEVEMVHNAPYGKVHLQIISYSNLKLVSEKQVTNLSSDYMQPAINSSNSP